MKSHVSLEQAQCPVCLAVFDTGTILFDKRLRQSMERNTVTHWEMCAEHKKLFDEGYVALVELTREPRGGEDVLCVPRTGQIAHIREAAWPKIMNVPVPPKKLCVVEAGVIGKVMALTGQTDARP